MKLGDAADPDAVKELQQKLASSLGFFSSLFLSKNGVFTASTQKFVKKFQGRNGLTQTGEVDKATWDLLDAQGKSSVGRVERTWDQTLTTGVSGMTSKYSWQVEKNRILVKVGVNFVADPAKPPTGLGTKVAKIKKMVLDTWNRFKAVRSDKKDERDIVFDIPDSGKTVNVVSGDGVSDAEHWFWGDVITYPNVPAHEFGHLISLEDEYQRPEAEYRRLHPGADEADITGAKGAQYGGDQYTNETSLMGMGSLDTHPDRVNPPEPRHVREFVKFIQDFVGGTWEARRR